MSEYTGPIDRLRAKRVGASANSVGAGRPSPPGYEIPWQDVCRSLLATYLAQQKQRYSRYGPTGLRNEIMRDHPWGKSHEDKRLRRNDLGHWFNNTTLGPDKFAFIDQFVRRLAVEGNDDSLRQAVLDEQFRRDAEIFSRLYVRRSPPEHVNCEVLGDLPWTVYCPEIIGAWYKSLFIRGTLVHNNIVRLIVGYMPVPLKSFSQIDFAHTVFYEGFLIPIEGERLGDERAGLGKIVCLIKLISPENDGMSDMGYADGHFEMTYNWIDVDSNVVNLSARREQFTLDYPSPVSYPMFSPADGENFRRYENNTYDKSVHDRLNRIHKDRLHEVEPRKLGAWYLHMKKDAKYDNTIDILLREHYRGYVY